MSYAQVVKRDAYELFNTLSSVDNMDVRCDVDSNLSLCPTKNYSECFFASGGNASYSRKMFIKSIPWLQSCRRGGRKVGFRRGLELRAGDNQRLLILVMCCSDKINRTVGLSLASTQRCRVKGYFLQAILQYKTWSKIHHRLTLSKHQWQRKKYF